MTFPPALLAFGLSSVLPWIVRYGYAGLAIGVFLESAGVPVPGETALLAAAFSAAHGALALPWVIAVAATASVLGDNLGFALGRRLGRGWVERHGHRLWLTPERFAHVDRFFLRYGPAAVALARFVTGVRVVAAFAAGTSRMSWAVFLPFNVLGALVWATLVSLAGYAVGRGFAGAGAWLGRTGLVLAAVVPAALLSAWLLRRWVARPLGIRERLVHIGGLRWIAAEWAVVVGVSTAGILAFAAIAEDVVERETTPFDTAVRTWALAHHTPLLDAVFTTLTWIGSPLVIGPLAAVAALVLWRRWGARVAAATVISPVVALALITVLKLLFHRVRPEGALHYAHLGYSFPSGHATGSMATALALAYVLVREGAAPRWSGAVAVVFGLLVGWSRLYLDVHWATDVVGGWAIGLAIAAGAAAVYERGRASARGAGGKLRAA